MFMVWMEAITFPNHVCGTNNTVEHALSCTNGAFPSIRHNKIKDPTAHLLTQVCPDVAVEPALQPLTGEHLHQSAITGDEARLDIKAYGFWNCPQQSAYYDVRVFNPHAASYAGNPWPHAIVKRTREETKV